MEWGVWVFKKVPLVSVVEHKAMVDGAGTQLLQYHDLLCGK